MIRNFTGRHMLAVMFLFFGTIIAVNMTMATLASRTFGGRVVENSYVASQKFNTWLAAARVQQRLGWTTAVAIEKGSPVVSVMAGDVPVRGATVAITAAHPLGRLPDRRIDMHQAADGRYAARSALPAGRWRLRVEIVRGGDRAVVIRDVTA